jgi:hypothetical protein
MFEERSAPLIVAESVFELMRTPLGRLQIPLRYESGVNHRVTQARVVMQHRAGA